MTLLDSGGDKEKNRLFNRPELTRLDARPAPDALFQVNGGRCFFLPGDCLHRTCLLAESEHLALIRIDSKLDQLHTDQGRASLVVNVCLVFISKVANRGKNRIRCGLS